MCSTGRKVNFKCAFIALAEEKELKDTTSVFIMRYGRVTEKKTLGKF